MADVTDNIKQARQAGYSDDEITKFLSGDSTIGPKVNEALGQGHASKDILDYLTTPIAPNTNAPINPPKSMGDYEREFVHGIGAGAVETGRGLANLGGKTIGIPPIPPSNFEQGTPGKIVSSDDQGTTFNAGKIAEKTGELFAPGTLIEKGVVKAGKLAAGGGKLGQGLAELSTRGLGEFSNMYLNDRAHGVSHEDALDNAKYAGVLGAGLEGIGAILKAVPPAGVYTTKDLMSKFPSAIDADGRNAAIQQAVDNAIPLTQGGLDKNAAIRSQTVNQRNAYLAQHANDPVDLNLVMAPIGRMAQQASVSGDTVVAKRVQKIWDDLATRYGATPATPGTPPTTTNTGVLGPNGQPITKVVPGTPGTPAKPPSFTVGDAEKVKEALYETLQDYYKRLSAAPGRNKVQANVARGMKDAIEDVVPEVKDLNQNIRNSKLLETAIKSYVKDNPGLLKNPWTIALAMSSELGLAGEHTFHMGLPAAGLYQMMANPRIRAALGIIKAGSDSSKILGGIPQTAARTIPQIHLLTPIPQRPQ